MSLLNKLTKIKPDQAQIDKAKGLLEKNAPKIVAGIDKATGVVDKRTGGRFSEQLQKVDQAAAKLAAKADAAPAPESTPDADPPVERSADDHAN